MEIPVLTYCEKMVLVVVILAWLAGCSSPELEPSRTVVIVNGEPGETLPFSISSPCGGIVMKEPLVNVTGWFSVPVKRGSSVYLYSAAQTSQSQVIEKLQKCSPLSKTEVGVDGRFSFPNSPAGDYIVMAQNGIFKGKVGHPKAEAVSQDLLVRTLNVVRTEEFVAAVFRLEQS